MQFYVFYRFILKKIIIIKFILLISVILFLNLEIVGLRIVCLIRIIIFLISPERKIEFCFRWSSIDLLSLFLIILTIWLSLLILIISYHVKFKFTFTNIIILLIISLIFRFSTFNILLFFFFFEITLIPIFLIIIGWGYQPERLRAGLLLIFYTIFASIPLLIIIIYWRENFYIYSFYLIVVHKFFTINFLLYVLITLTAFSIKLPIFLVHLWLPKAHVEAPVAGSIILAGVLLKLGGYGLIRLSPIVGVRNYILLYFFIATWGGRILGLLCIQHRDIKVLIAYSSIVHMALVLVGGLSGFFWGVEGAIIIIFAHGVCSSGIFAWANIIYERSHSRSLILNKGLLRVSPFIRIIWAILIIGNFGGPFTLNLLGEIILIINIISISFVFFLCVIILSFFSAAYRLILFRSTQQGSAVSSIYPSLDSTSRECQLLFSHIWPIILLIISPTIT